MPHHYLKDNSLQADTVEIEPSLAVSTAFDNASLTCRKIEIAGEDDTGPQHFFHPQYGIGTLRVGIIGSGYIARGLTLSLRALSDIVVTKVLTRSEPKLRRDSVWDGVLTNLSMS